MSIVTIITTIITGAELAVKVGEVRTRCVHRARSTLNDVAPRARQVAKKLIPEPPKQLTDKFRWVQCTIKNETQFDLLLQGTYFDSGRYWDAPGSFGSFNQMVFSCCNGDHTVMTGVTGGTEFRLSLDDQHYYDIALVSNVLSQFPLTKGLL